MEGNVFQFHVVCTFKFYGEWLSFGVLWLVRQRHTSCSGCNNCCWKWRGRCPTEALYQLYVLSTYKDFLSSYFCVFRFRLEWTAAVGRGRNLAIRNWAARVTIGESGGANFRCWFLAVRSTAYRTYTAVLSSSFLVFCDQTWVIILTTVTFWESGSEPWTAGGWWQSQVVELFENPFPNRSACDGSRGSGDRGYSHSQVHKKHGWSWSCWLVIHKKQCQCQCLLLVGTKSNANAQRASLNSSS